MRLDRFTSGRNFVRTSDKLWSSQETHTGGPHAGATRALNRIFAAAKREADSIVDAGIATPEDIDRAMMTGRNWPAGSYGQRGGIGKQW